MSDHDEESGGKPHTSPDEGHPAGDGERTDRDVGGPTAPEDAGDGEETGGAPGGKESPFDSHE
jgi:hypothetical protein